MTPRRITHSSQLQDPLCRPNDEEQQKGIPNNIKQKNPIILCPLNKQTTPLSSCGHGQRQASSLDQPMIQCNRMVLIRYLLNRLNNHNLILETPSELMVIALEPDKLDTAKALGAMLSISPRFLSSK